MKKALSIVLSIMVILTVVTAIPFSALETTKVSAVSLTYDPDAIYLNVAYTEGEVSNRVRDNTDVQGEGYAIDSCSLMYKPGDSWYGIGYGTEQVQAGRKYGIEYQLEVTDGYEWLDEVKAFTSQTAIESCPALTVNVNGTKRTDVTIEYNEYWNQVTVWVPIGTASTTPIITAVEIDGNDISLGVGETFTFVANVGGTATDKTIIWSVEGAASAATTITSGGVLTVGEDETAESITVKATSNFDNTKYSQKTVTVLAAPATIDSVTVTPGEITLKQKSTCTFKANVEGTQTDKSVIWSVEGATSANTAISDSGVLTIGYDENAATLTVIATAVQDNDKHGTATVTVEKLTRINTVSLTFNAESINLTTESTEGEVSSRIRDNTDVQGEGYAIYRSDLMYKSGNSWNGIGYGTEQVQTDRKYGIEYQLEVTDGYEWLDEVKAFTSQTDIASCPSLTVYVNGTKRTDVMISYNDYWNYIDVYVPIDFYVATPDGWQKTDGKWYYYKDGDALTGWQKIGNKWYYFEADGIMQSGWQKLSGKWYYFGGANDGVMKTGWQKLGGKWYYFGGAEDGVMKTGWQKLGGKWYYFGGAEDGVMKTGWQKINNKWYYFGGAEDGVMKTGWQKIGGKWYYFGGAEDGVMKTGWQKISGKWYYFGGAEDGVMKTDWVKSSGKWYYMDTNGAMVYSCSKTINGKTYKFDANGVCTNP